MNISCASLVSKVILPCNRACDKNVQRCFSPTASVCGFSFFVYYPYNYSFCMNGSHYVCLLTVLLKQVMQQLYRNSRS